MEEQFRPGGKIDVPEVASSNVLALSLCRTAELIYEYSKLARSTIDDEERTSYERQRAEYIKEAVAIVTALASNSDHVVGMTPESLYFSARDAAEERDYEDAIFLTWTLTDLFSYKKYRGEND